MENKFDKILLKLIEISVASSLALMFIIVITGVFSRYIFHHPIFGIEEFARYTMFYMVMLGSAVAFREETHPALLFIIQKFPIRFVKVWNYIKDTIIIIILIIIFKEGYFMALKEIISKSPALRISFFWIYLAFPIGALLMISQIITNCIFREKSFKNK
jgi:TRAP-type C4-dicarboxylate transport system permease small subunit